MVITIGNKEGTQETKNFVFTAEVGEDYSVEEILEAVSETIHTKMDEGFQASLIICCEEVGRLIREYLFNLDKNGKRLFCDVHASYNGATIAYSEMHRKMGLGWPLIGDLCGATIVAGHLDKGILIV